jgi:Tol biopolymer transport system component
MGSQLRITNYALLFSFLFLLSCTPQQPSSPTQSSLYIYRFDPPAFVEFSEDLEQVNEIPFSIPLNCGLFDVFPAPVGPHLLIELSCPNGQAVLFLDTESGATSQPITDSDSHFLAWTSEGESAYLKVDSLGNARVVRANTDGTDKDMSVIGWTYDLAAKPGSNDFIFSFSRGMGAGSELHFTQNDGRTEQLLYADKFNYIAFARYSLDGKQIAFIKIPDSQTPFTVGELWVMDADGSDPRKLADADAGHGYAANWSPDGTKIAFVGRDNPENEAADQSIEALVSNVYFVYVDNGTITKVTNFTEGYVETPRWSPGGNTLSFNAVINGRINVFTVDIVTGQSHPLITDVTPTEGSTCCPAWMRK